MTPVGAIPVAGGPLDRSDDGIFFLRPDGQDERFLRSYLPEGTFHAAIVAGRLLAPHPLGSIERSHGRRGDELAWLLEDAAVPWIGDPDTSDLSEFSREDLPAKRLGLMPHAELYDLPWTLELLDDPETLEAIARNALAAQLRSFAAAAVYLQAESRSDPWFDVNVRAVRETAKWAAGRPVCAFVQVPLGALLDGSLARAADDYARAGARIAVLRVAGFRADDCDLEEASAYVNCVRTWRAAGVAPVADCAGRFGAALVCAGAWGFSAGARFYRRVGARTEQDAIRRRAPSVHLEVPGQWRSLTPRAARARARLPDCPETDCEPLAPDGQPGRLKAHFVHAHVRMAESAAQMSESELIEQLRSAPGGQSDIWAAALVADAAAQQL